MLVFASSPQPDAENKLGVQNALRKFISYVGYKNDEGFRIRQIGPHKGLLI